MKFSKMPAVNGELNRAKSAGEILEMLEEMLLTRFAMGEITKLEISRSRVDVEAGWEGGRGRGAAVVELHAATFDQR
jgi:hypothetical protein